MPSSSNTWAVAREHSRSRPRIILRNTTNLKLKTFEAQRAWYTTKPVFIWAAVVLSRDQQSLFP